MRHHRGGQLTPYRDTKHISDGEVATEDTKAPMSFIQALALVFLIEAVAVAICLGILVII